MNFNYPTGNTGSELTWPYRLQPHPTDPSKLSSQQILGKAMAPNAPWRRVGFGGPKGGGKSYGTRAVSFGLTYRLPIVIVIIRSRLTTLKRNHIIPAKNELKPFLDRDIIHYNEKDKIFYMPKGMVMFMHCSRPADVEQFDGIGADVYIFEEAGHFTREMMKGIYKNNRSSDLAIANKVSYIPRVLFTFNWGGRGHEALRDWFWDGIYSEHERAKDYFFIFAPLDQNTALLERDPYYKQTLLELPKQLREAYLTGDPDAFVGTMFTVIDEIHQISIADLLEKYNPGKQIEQYTIPYHWRLIASLDAGVGAPCAFGLYAVTPEGRKYKLFSYKQKGLKAPQHVQNICDMIEACKITGGRRPDFIVSDSWAFQKHNNMDVAGGDITWEDLFAKNGYPLYQVKYNRITAIMGLQTALHFEFNDENTALEVEPQLMFVEGKNDSTIKELRAAKHSEHNPELIEEDADDHNIDETKNFLLCALDPPNYVPLKKIPKHDPKEDYGSYRNKLKEIQSENEESFEGIITGGLQ